MGQLTNKMTNWRDLDDRLIPVPNQKVEKGHKGTKWLTAGYQAYKGRDADRRGEKKKKEKKDRMDSTRPEAKDSTRPDAASAQPGVQIEL